ncbi:MULTISPECIES: homocysteine S-methyltransferase family protein [Vibrio]|uniref:homocysteine S-methyltransferase family protein n=1 Tax=Vibrio TaxID=662 RepID=UPI0011EC05F9|nr:MULTISPECIES: homocysteine S-methyltransferase family protein [Vibrio]EGR1564659.1 homocysteine S-methyltransferase family protein [Vibrio alginolyticus]EHA1205931.1 homocysteine S-methyltransferase family protein [Vibrio alginolyticus]MBN3001509.1 homocysteine S-methyltransferase family protein [Vibrio alginolyticus]MBS9829074.1 homocysteine S-methyltransferase family protein [Vibrio alginolyticus]MCK8113108.1 homocysteine S-methyltransferase family protein [Vibrio sp. 2CM40D]
MKKVTILDGGMGRELKRIGAPFSQPLWSAQALIESPQHVKMAHENFIDAGAEIITVNSYACVPFHLGEELYAKRGTELAKSAAKIARDVVTSSNGRVLVAGSLPPVMGSYRPELFEPKRALEVASELFEAQDQYVDIWLAETVSSLAEVEVLSIILAKTDKPNYLAFTLMDEPNSLPRLRSGESLKVAVNTLLKTNVSGIFFNCSIPEVVEQAIIDTQAVLSESGRELTIGVFANSFAPIKQAHQANETIQEVRHFSPTEYLEYAKKWHAQGASIIGGCCGIEPRHIKLLATWRDTLENA